MATTKDYLDQLTADKATLVQILNAKGVTASDSETFTELVPKVDDIQTGGGNVGYQVTFKVDGNDYYIASCQQGESITEPPTPTSQTGNFKAWQLNGVDVSFPYTPRADVELTAAFSSVRTEMEITEANTILLHNTNYNADLVKTTATASPDFAIMGYYISTSNNYEYDVLIGKTNADVAVTYYYSPVINTFTYNGETYYYARASANSTYITNRNAKAYHASNVTGTDNWNDLVTATLDHYFYND